MALDEYTKQVAGDIKADIALYTLSTCGWCRKTKDLLKDLGVEYRYIDVDLLQGEARSQAIEELSRWNPSRSFPTIVVNGDRCIVGFQEEKLKEAVGVGAR
jgi:glutaredoxin-like protein NrdH